MPILQLHVYPAKALTQSGCFPYFSRIHLELAPLLHLQHLPEEVAVAAAEDHAVPVIIKAISLSPYCKKDLENKFSRSL
jgi:hypothetical protein